MTFDKDYDAVKFVLPYQVTRGEVSVNTRYFIEHLIFPRKSIKHFLYK